MEQPKVAAGDWIFIKSENGFSGIDGYVFNVHSNGVLSVGYYQNKSKAIKEEVIWKDNRWQFKCSGPNGSYLRGNDAKIVESGPNHRK
jgi:hypothetical protein